MCTAMFRILATCSDECLGYIQFTVLFYLRQDSFNWQLTLSHTGIGNSVLENRKTKKIEDGDNWEGKGKKLR